MERVTLDLANLVRDKFFSKFGLDSKRILRTLFLLVDEAENKLNEHKDRIQTFFKKKSYSEVIKTYNEVFPENVPIKDDQAKYLWGMAGEKLENLKYLLVCHADLKLDKIYTFGLDKITEIYGASSEKAKIRTIFDHWSYSFGDLKNRNKEFFILDNPVHSKPFIKLDELSYYCPIIGVLPHLSISLLEKLIFEDSEWKAEYTSKIKPKYLENEVERLFAENFPNALLLRGSIWHDTVSNKDYENDLLLVLDNFAIVAECKSGMLTPLARRGAPESLTKTLKRLVEEPAGQTIRFADFLKNKKEKHRFATKSGVVNEVDSSAIDYYIPLGITLEEIGTIGSNVKKLIRADMVKKDTRELVPSISLADLEIVLDLLPLEAEKIHYLARRREFERNVDYEADEVDLIGFYLDNGFNVGDFEFEQDRYLNLTLKSKEIDPYYVAKGEGKTINKPKHAMTDWWRDLLFYISKRKPRKWIEASYILLNTTKEDQKEFERIFDDLKNRVKHRRVRQKHNWIVFSSGPQQKRFFIIGYVYRTNDKKERNDIISSIFSSEISEESRGAICIGYKVKSNEYPYSVLASIEKNRLFIDVT